MAIKKCKTEEDIRQVEEYLGSDYLKVPYLYSNLYSYGIGNSNVEVWADIMCGQINGIYLRYFTCLHFYTKNSDYPEISFLQFVEQLNPEVIMLQETFGKVIQSFLELYLLSRGYIVQQDLGNAEYSNMVGYANRNDIKEITELLMDDPIYQKIYTKENLYSQLLERFDAGYGKCCIIRKDGKIVANYSVNSENDKFVFLGSAIVHPNYRRMGLGGLIKKYLDKYALDKGIECLGLIEEDNVASLELNKKMNTSSIGMIYKFIKL